MKTILYSIIAIAVVLTLCFMVSLIRGKITGKKMRWTNLILPLIALLLFVGLFVGSSISRNNLRKELLEMKEDTEKLVDYESRLSALEERYTDLSFIIGKDQEIEKQIELLRR